MERLKTEGCRVLVVDGHPVAARGMLGALEGSGTVSTGVEAVTAADAIAMAASESPDLIVSELVLDGVVELPVITRLATHAPVLVFSAFDERVFASRAIRAGARGYLMKSAPLDELSEAAQAVIAGRLYVSTRMTAKMVAQAAGRPQHQPSVSEVEKLTDRELQVMLLIGQAQRTGRIAELLGVSVKTVETHRSAIKRKLGLDSGPELMRYAVSWNLTGVGDTGS